MRGTVANALATSWVHEGAGWDVCIPWFLGIIACSSGDRFGYIGDLDDGRDLEFLLRLGLATAERLKIR